MMLHTLLIVCEPGLHILQLTELKNLGYSGEVVNAASVRVENATDDDVVRLNYLLRQALGVYVVLWEGSVDTLDDIRQAGAEADYAMWLDSKQSFRVEADRFGEHTFRSPQIAGAIGQRIVNQFMDRSGVRVRADLDLSDVRFHALLYDDHLVISVNTSGEHLRDRHPRVYRHRSSLRPSIAAAMIGLSSFGTGRSLFDPMAGGGTLPTEACLIKKGIPAGVFRPFYAFEKLVNFDARLLDSLRAKKREPFLVDNVQIGACDRSVKALTGMRQNFEAQGLIEDIDHWEDDAEQLRKLDAGRFQIMISNPSYGIWNGSVKLAHQTYEQVPKRAVEKGIDEMVMITPDDEWIIECAEKSGYHLTDRIPFMHGDLENRMVRFMLNAPNMVVT
jgi:tRNA (guanine6-N2)-methyltransferase